MFRCQILINGISYEATDDLKNWDDFGISQKRSNYDGVIRSFSTQFEFVNRSYELLKEEFEQHYLSAKAAIVFYLRNNSWNWDKIFHCTLDFGTYSEDGMVVSINAVDDNLAAIIKATGWRQPITVSTRSGLIVKGHGRLAAAKYGKFKEAPVDYQNYASEEEELADLMADNRIAELAEIDSVKLAEAFEAVDTGAIPFEMTGYEESFYQELATALCEADHDKEEADDDTVLPPPEEPVSKLGDVWILGRHRLMCGNSTNTKDREELLAGAEPELMLTDPPYCSGGHQESGKSTGSIGTVRKGQTDAPKIANDILSTRGYIKLLTAAFEGITPLFAYVFTDWRMWIYLYDIIEKSGFGVRSMIVWDKETPGMGVGWRSQHELCLFGSRGKAKFDGHKGYGNVLRCSRSGNELHPTQKPVELMEMILDNMDFVKTVYDPFGGSGTTLAAAEKTGHTAYLMELTPGYTDVIVKRYFRITGNKAQIQLIRDGAPADPAVYAEIFDDVGISSEYKEGEYE